MEWAYKIHAGKNNIPFHVRVWARGHLSGGYVHAHTCVGSLVLYTTNPVSILGLFLFVKASEFLFIASVGCLERLAVFVTNQSRHVV